MRRVPATVALLLASACGDPAPDAASKERTVTVSGSVRGPYGSSLPPGIVIVDPWWIDRFSNDYKGLGSPRPVGVDATGSFSVAFDGVPRDQDVCVLRLSFEADDAPWVFEEDELFFHSYLKRPIPDQLNFDAVRLSAPSAARPFASLTDDELERRIRTSWADGGNDVPLPWSQLMGEALRRDETRWEALFQELLASFVETDRALEGRDRIEHWYAHGELELLTALRRLQGQPDPISIEVMRGSDLVVDAPEFPRLVLRIRNRDSMAVQLQGTDGWYWRIRGRRLDGTALGRNRRYSIGYSEVRSSIRLQPGGSSLHELRVADQLEPFTGVADLQLTYCSGAHIDESLASLEGLMLFHPDVVRVDVRASGAGVMPARRPDAPDLWPHAADDARIRVLAEEAGVPLLEANGVLLVAASDCERFVDVLERHDLLLLRIEAWWREEVGARREPADDEEFSSPEFGTDPGDGARSILEARLWLQGGGGSGARYVFHVREHERE
jgi:hypothetical protein